MKYTKSLQVENHKLHLSQRGRLTPLTITAGLLLVATIFFTIETATSGAELANLKRQEAELLEENRRLSASLITISSLTALEDKAKSLGFVKPGKIIYVFAPEEVAKIPQP